MPHAHILEALTAIFRDIFDDDSLELSLETTSDDIDHWDSLNHINILVAAESRFRIKFNTAEIEGLKDVGELVHLIAKKSGASA